MSDDRLADGYEPRWDIDAAVGRQGELWISDIRKALEGSSVEVKTDEKFVGTGNIYVEYECLRLGHYVPSGLAITEADVWVYVLRRDSLALVVATATLKTLLRSLYRKGVARKVECGRGSHPTRGLVVPVSALVDELRTAERRAA